MLRPLQLAGDVLEALWFGQGQGLQALLHLSVAAFLFFVELCERAGKAYLSPLLPLCLRLGLALQQVDSPALPLCKQLVRCELLTYFSRRDAPSASCTNRR